MLKRERDVRSVPLPRGRSSARCARAGLAGRIGVSVMLTVVTTQHSVEPPRLQVKGSLRSRHPDAYRPGIGCTLPRPAPRVSRAVTEPSNRGCPGKR